VLIEAALLAPLAPLYRSPEWEGWPYVTETLQQLSGSPIPDDKRYDFEYLVRMLIEIPIMYGPAQGRTRSEDVLTRVVDVMRPMWNDERAGSELTVESLAGIPHRALALYEANSVCLAALDALRRNMPNLTSAPLPGGKLKHFTGLEHPELILEHMQAFWGASAERGSVHAP
jgi:pimeloyl-ACP methyl ester carboxylesterase